MSPADISIEFVEHEFKGFKLLLIKDPLQSHVVAWEQASRAFKNEDAKPTLQMILNELAKVSITETDLSTLIVVLNTISDALKGAIKILNDNETLTLSSNRGVMVKAAVKSGWIVSPQMTPDEVDNLKPWLVHWIAQKVAALYMEATEIPKN